MPTPSPRMTIGTLARAGGVGVETVRYYQRRALLEVPSAQGGVRHYGEPALRRLRFIRGAQQAGFTLEEIRELLALDAGQDHVRARAMAQARLAVLERQIDALQQARSRLQRLARQCSGSRKAPCPILAAFDE